MTRRECLDEAAKCVLQDRACEYGGMEDNFGRIAKLWTHYLGVAVDAVDVAMCMALLKVARIRNNKAHADSYVDLAGYAACGAECAHSEEERLQAVKEAGREYAAARAKADRPEEGFKPGDRVQALIAESLESDEKKWLSATYIRYDNDFERCHVVDAGVGVFSVKANEILPAPKAEGCEELVVDAFSDAPRTPQELYQRIVDCNPATFKARTPTGEELAEIAREDGDGA